MNNSSSLNEVEAVDNSSSLLDAEGAAKNNAIGAVHDAAAPTQAKDGRSSSIQPFSVVEGAAAPRQQPALMSHSPPSLMAGGKGLGADIGTDPQAVSISGMSESSSQTSLESVEMLNGRSRLGQSQTFGMNALQRRLSQSKKEKFEVYMRCVTWSRDSHGLFDYESRYISKKNIKTGQSGRIVRLNNDVEFISMDMRPEDLDPSAKPLITITQNARGKFVITNDSGSSGQSETSRQRRRDNAQDGQDESTNAANMMFVVVRNLKSQKPPENSDQNGQQLNSFLHDFRLQRGNIIKLGRLKFSVKDFRTDQQPANCDLKRRGVIDRSASPVKQRYRVAASKTADGAGGARDGEDDSENEFNAEEAVEIDCGVVQQQDGCEVQCKVCWSSDQTRINPLLNSCKCDGSVRFIHYECLKFWLKQKMAVKEEPNQVSYMWKQFECEICKTPYPYVFKSNGNRFRLVDVEIPKEKNFLWLESLTFEKNSSRMVHVVMPDRDHTQFKMGRGHESDLRVSDISVSRCHAILKYDIERTHSYYLEDNLSKFGTLVLSEHPIELEVDETQAVQIGRSVISFTVKQVIESPASAMGASLTEEEVPRAIQYQPVPPTQLMGNQPASQFSGVGRVTTPVMDRSPPQVLESVGLYPAQAQQHPHQPQQQTTQPSAYAPPGGTAYRQQVQQQLQSQTTGSFEEQKHQLRTPSPVRRGNQAQMLLSASNQQTAYRPHQQHRNETSNPRMPAAGILLDHHSTTFTPLAASGSQRRTTAQRLMQQQPSRHASLAQQQQDEIFSDDRNNSNDDDMLENDPDAAAELLRQKIEETNQKISDYFRQQQRLQAAQQQQSQSSTLLPQRLDFYNHQQQAHTSSYPPHRQHQHDEVKEDLEASSYHLQQSSNNNNRRHHHQHPRVPNLDLSASRLASKSPVNYNDSRDIREINATESLNQTLKRFQSMIQQVEQRFAEREKINCSSPIQGLEPSEVLKERNTQYQGGSGMVQQQQSPIRGAAQQRNLNDYDIAKQQIEEKQQLLNSQYSLHPSSSQSAPRYGHNHCSHHEATNQKQMAQSQYGSPQHHHNNTASVSRQNLLDALNRAVSAQPSHQQQSNPPTQLQQQTSFYQGSPTRQQYGQYNNHSHSHHHGGTATRHYELSRERSIQQVIQKSPTKMYQADCISPNRRQLFDHGDAVGVVGSNYAQLQPRGDQNSYRSGACQQTHHQMHDSNNDLSRSSFELQPQLFSSDVASPYLPQRQQQHEDLLCKISDTIRHSEAHKASVNERLQKAKSMAAATSATPELYDDNFSATPYSRQQSQQFGGGPGAKKQSTYQQLSSNKHSFVGQQRNGRGGPTTETTSKQRQQQQPPMMASRYDVDYFGASDIKIGTHQQASPVRPGGERHHVAANSNSAAVSKRQQSYSMLAAASQQQQSSGNKINKARQDNNSSINLKSSIRGGASMNQTVVHHDYPRRQQQSSPVHQHKRHHQASPTKVTTAGSKRPQSAYKSPMRQSHGGGGYSGKHSHHHHYHHNNYQLPTYSYQRQHQQQQLHQQQAPPSYSGSANRYSGLQKQSSSFYEQSRGAPTATTSSKK